MNTKDQRDEQITLELLETIGRDSKVSQRHLASHLGMALGLTNSYLKRCIRKGYVKITEAPANRYLYYLTPKGFAEKTQLTAKYLSHTLSFYREATNSCERLLHQCEQKGWGIIVLCGVSDLAEIVALHAKEFGISILGTYDTGTEQQRFLNRPVWRKASEMIVSDGYILTDLVSPLARYQELVETFGSDKLLIPDVLRFE